MFISSGNGPEKFSGGHRIRRRPKKRQIAVDRKGEKDSLLERQHNENVYLEKQEARAVWLGKEPEPLVRRVRRSVWGLSWECLETPRGSGFSLRNPEGSEGSRTLPLGPLSSSSSVQP